MSKIIWANLARRSRAFNRFLRFWRSGETSFPGLMAISQRQFENQPRSTKGFIGRGPKHRSIALGRVSASRYLSMRGNVITVSSFSTLCLHSCFLHSANCNPPPPLPDCATRLCSRCSPARDSHSTYLSPPLSLSPYLRVSVPPLRSSVTSPPRVDWIHLTGYMACDITALWCMAKRVVALRHHNLTTAMEWNGSRGRGNCSRLAAFNVDIIVIDGSISINKSVEFKQNIVEVYH